ncbi:MAG: DEAD/DEAH box helicase [Acidimicrobiia bacterium]
MTSTFAHLGLPDPLVQSLAKREIVEPFPVQEATIPDALAGRDVCGKAPTGSGKTLAFGLPLLAKVDKASRQRPRALILAPTRELAEQIKQDLAPLARTVNRYVFAIYGGVGYGPQKGALRKGVDVLVATPGRLEDLIEQRSIDLREVDIVVVDEADRMADMGFLPAVRRILDQTSSNRQTLLYSATLDGDVAVLIREYQNNPARHETGTVDTETIDARHHFWLVQHHDRIQHTADLVDEMGKTIVFTRTRHGADRLARQLDKAGIGAVAMHGGRSQNQRSRALKAFSSGRAQALIATDVAARGIHVDAVATVIHFDPAGDHKDYLHRSGRTARAGATGTVVSLVTGEQRRSVQRMQRDLKLDAPIEEPRMENLHNAGHRIGEPASELETRRPVAKRPAAKAKSPNRRSPSGAQSVYVANLPWRATTDELEAMFGRYGKVHETTIIAHPRTGRSKGFGFVEMPASDARTAVKELHGSVMGGRDLTVRLARPSSHRD